MPVVGQPLIRLIIRNRNLVSLPASILELSHLVSFDMRTRSSAPTDIRLYLANNFLNSNGLPSQLFQIHNLTSLYLRSNNLEELPAAIGELKNLKDLNVAMNKLRYLPAEILQLKLENLRTSPNPFLKFEKSQKSKDGGKQKYHCVSRTQKYRVPSLVELVTRRLLEPIPTCSTIQKNSISPSSHNSNTRRHFHNVRDEAISPRTDNAPLPPHLLKAFLPLIQPLPYHLRALLRDEGSILPSSDGLKSCSVCKGACVNFAEERLNWRYEIAGQKIADAEHEEQWVPVLWRGCNPNCLDFLDE